jgi:S-formylglutathione hydrolase
MHIRSEQRAFGGVQGFYEHDGGRCGPMRFAVYLPPTDGRELVPALYYLPGLTCTEDTFVIKAGAQRLAAEYGIALVSCDTSPRATRIEGDAADWDFGQGAGFYLDATRAPWAATYQMETYVIEHLLGVVEANFPIARDRRGITGHSMGGHGALTLALRHRDRFASVSALAPIVAPSQVPWGHKAFGGYLGDDRAAWAAHDTCALLARGARFASPPLIDIGLADKFLEAQLRPELLEAACIDAGQAITVRRHAGYDHSYYFVATMIADHLRHHAAALAGR